MSASERLRSVFIEYQPTKDTSSEYRPFHHARVVVTDLGQHQNGELLDAQSSGFVYDRIDGVVIGTTTKDKVLERKDAERYTGLPAGWRSVYYGYTDMSFSQIQQAANDIVMEQQNAGRNYNIVTNNCLTFAEELVSRINEKSAEDGPFEGVKALRVLTADPGKSYYTISEAERGLAILHDEDTASQLTSDFIDLRMRHYPSDERSRDPWPPRPESHWKASGVYGESFRNEIQPDWYSRPKSPPGQGDLIDNDAEDTARDDWKATPSYGGSFRNELQPDWYSRSPASPDQDDFTQYSASEDIVRDSRIETETENENDKTSDHGGNPWRFESPF